MKLQLTSMDSGSQRSRVRRAYVQLRHERDTALVRLEEEILATGRGLKWLTDKIKMARVNPSGNRRNFNILGELQNDAARVNTLAGYIRGLDEALEILEQALERPPSVES